MSEIIIMRILHSFLSFFLVIPLLLTTHLPAEKYREIEVNNNSDNTYKNEYGDPVISAHRSGAGAAPQNTLMAFQKMIEEKQTYGVDIFEFDVQITKDGELILLHNLTYDDTSNAREEFGRRNVFASSLTFEEARRLNLSENFKIYGKYPYRGLRGDDIPENLRAVKCEDIINYIENNSGDKKYKYIIEIKTPGKKAADKFYKIIKDTDITDRVIWATYQPSVSLYMQKNIPIFHGQRIFFEVFKFYIYCRMGWDLNEQNINYVALQIPYGKCAFDGRINLGTRQLTNYAHKYNIAVQYCTINKSEHMKELIECGADCIMSDRPDKVLVEINNFKGAVKKLSPKKTDRNL